MRDTAGKGVLSCASAGGRLTKLWSMVSALCAHAFLSNTIMISQGSPIRGWGGQERQMPQRARLKTEKTSRDVETDRAHNPHDKAVQQASIVLTQRGLEAQRWGFEDSSEAKSVRQDSTSSEQGMNWRLSLLRSPDKLMASQNQKYSCTLKFRISTLTDLTHEIFSLRKETDIYLPPPKNRSPRAMWWAKWKP